MQGEIHLTNLKKMYPEAEITAKDEGFLITFTDLAEVYSEDFDVTITQADVKPEYQLFKGKLCGKNKYSFEFVNKEFTNSNLTMTITVTDGLESDVTDTIDITVMPYTANTEDCTITHGIPNLECIFVTDKDFNLIGVIRD